MSKWLFDKNTKTIQWEKNSLFNKCAGTTEYPHVKWQNWTSTYLTWYTKIHSRWIKKPKCRSKTTHILKENTSLNLCDPGVGNGFLDVTPKA